MVVEVPDVLEARLAVFFFEIFEGIVVFLFDLWPSLVTCLAMLVLVLVDLVREFDQVFNSIFGLMFWDGEIIDADELMILSAAENDVEGDLFEFLLFFISQILFFLNVFDDFFESIDIFIDVRGVWNSEVKYC